MSVSNSTQWSTRVLHEQDGTSRGRRWKIVSMSQESEERILALRGATSQGPSNTRLELDLSSGKKNVLKDIADMRRALDSMEAVLRDTL